MQIWIIVIPIWVIAMVILVGGSVLVDFVNDAEFWIQQHYEIICIVIVAIYALIVIVEAKKLRPVLKNKNTSVPVFVVCSSIRAAASAAYLVFLVTGIAATFTVSYSIWENIQEVFGLLLMTIPIFAFQIFEGILDFETSNGGAIVGCVLSTAGSVLGMVIFQWDFLPRILRYIFS